MRAKSRAPQRFRSDACSEAARHAADERPARDLPASSCAETARRAAAGRAAADLEASRSPSAALQPDRTCDRPRGCSSPTWFAALPPSSAEAAQRSAPSREGGRTASLGSLAGGGCSSACPAGFGRMAAGAPCEPPASLCSLGGGGRSSPRPEGSGRTAAGSPSEPPASRSAGPDGDPPGGPSGASSRRSSPSCVWSSLAKASSWSMESFRTSEIQHAWSNSFSSISLWVCSGIRTQTLPSSHTRSLFTRRAPRAVPLTMMWNRSSPSTVSWILTPWGLWMVSPLITSFIVGLALCAQRPSKGPPRIQMSPSSQTSWSPTSRAW
mmetsp:Transcript_27724/g.87611  ORF Transcript_27724/g.87611 Transcript_27724/m.87611 type:complete len:324 (-) Transcript_27724:474-1445(-)